MAEVTHNTTIHAQCPNGGWDYYEVSFQPDAFMQCEDFEKCCNQVRGRTEWQETLADTLAELLPEGTLMMRGKHGSNTTTMIKVECFGEMH